MLRDPEQFRLRFNRWKNGELVYLNGRPTELPKYEDGVVPPVTTGGSGLPVPYVRQPKLQLNLEGQKIKLFLERASNFAPYVGTIQDWKEVADGNLNKLPSAVIGTIADIALPGLRTSIKAAKATRKLMITTPRIVDKAKYYRATQKATRKAIMNGAYQGVGTYQDILDDLGLYPKYKDGIVGSIKNAILGASIAEDPAVATAAGWLLTNNGVVQRPNLSTRLLSKALTELSFFSPTNPITAATDAALKFVVPGAKALVGRFLPIKLKGDSTIEEVLKYGNKHNSISDFPEFTNIGDFWGSEAVKARDAAVKFYRQDVLPRIKKVSDVWIRNGKNVAPQNNIATDVYSNTPEDVYHTYEMFNLPMKVIDVGPEHIGLGGWNSADGTYIVKSDYPIFNIDDVLIHEAEHAQRRAIGTDAVIGINNQQGAYGLVLLMLKKLLKTNQVNPFQFAYSTSEDMALNDAYQFTADFVKNRPVIEIAEKGATNRQMRYALSKQNNNVVGDELDAVIDNLSTKDIELLLSDTNGYSRDFLLSINNQIDNLVKSEGITKAAAKSKVWGKYRNAIKRALKYVPASTAVAPVVKNKSKK